MTTTRHASASPAEVANVQSGHRPRTIAAKSGLLLYKPIVCRIVGPRCLSLHDLSDEQRDQEEGRRCNRNCAADDEALREVAEADFVTAGRHVDREKRLICAQDADATA